MEEIEIEIENINETVYTKCININAGTYMRPPRIVVQLARMSFPKAPGDGWEGGTW